MKHTYRYLITIMLSAAMIVAGTSANAQSSSQIEKARQMARQMGYKASDVDNFLKNGKIGNRSEKVDGRKSISYSESRTRQILGEEADSDKMLSRDSLIMDSLLVAEEIVQLNEPEAIWGHSFFSNSTGKYLPGMNIPTPKNYIISAGDELFIDMWGSTVNSFSDTVSPDGYINIPDLGPVYVVGLTVDNAQKRIKEQLATIHSGLMDTSSPSIDLRLSVGSMHTIVVNVAGEAVKPGAYPVPSLSTMITALYKCKGVTDLAGVRELKLYRNGKLIETFDLYSYLSGRFTGSLTRLQDNDLVYIGSYSARATVAGEVKRPMKYDMKENETLLSLLNYTGGFTAGAKKDVIFICRFNDGDTLSFSIPKESFGSFKLQDGDSLTIYNAAGVMQNRVTIEGAVRVCGDFAIDTDIIKLSDLLKRAGGLTNDAYTKWCTIQRQNDIYEPISISVNLEDVLSGRNDVTLQKEDKIHIFSMKSLVIESEIIVSGAVKNPQSMKYHKGMTLRDAILLCNGFTIDATLAKIDIARRNNNTNSTTPSEKISQVFTYNLVENEEAYNIELKPYDMIMVRTAPDYKPQKYVLVKGDVVFPGTHVVEKDVVRLTDIIAKTGGFLNTAYVKGTQLSRRFTEAEKKQLEMAAKIANEKAKQDGDSTKQFNIEDFGEFYTIAIDLQKALDNPESDANIIMREGDEILVPSYTNTVKISGYVLRPASVTYNKNLKWKDYVNMAGGFAKGAIRRKTYALHMNGTVSTKSWGSLTVEPGSEIIVPGKELKDRNQFNFANIATATTMLTSLTTLVAYLTKL